MHRGIQPCDAAPRRIPYAKGAHRVIRLDRENGKTAVKQWNSEFASSGADVCNRALMRKAAYLSHKLVKRSARVSRSQVISRREVRVVPLNHLRQFRYSY